jgi:hypothetical protein
MRSTANSWPLAWQAVQPSHSTVVLARRRRPYRCHRGNPDRGNPGRTAEIGGVVLVKPPGLETVALAPTFSTRKVPVLWQADHFKCVRSSIFESCS